MAMQRESRFFAMRISRFYNMSRVLSQWKQVISPRYCFAPSEVAPLQSRPGQDGPGDVASLFE